MTTTDLTGKPSEVLAHAADLIQEAAKKAGAEHDCARESCGGLGDYHGPCGGCCTCLSGCVYDGPGDNDVAPGSWLDLMRPASVAPHLAALLRAARGMWLLYEGRGWTDEKLNAHVGAEHRVALDLALAVVSAAEDGERG